MFRDEEEEYFARVRHLPFEQRSQWLRLHRNVEVIVEDEAVLVTIVPPKGENNA